MLLLHVGDDLANTPFIACGAGGMGGDASAGQAFGFNCDVVNDTEDSAEQSEARGAEGGSGNFRRR